MFCVCCEADKSTMQTVDSVAAVMPQTTEQEVANDEVMPEPFDEDKPAPQPIEATPTPEPKAEVAQPKDKEEPESKEKGVPLKDTDLTIVVDRSGSEKLGMVAFNNTGEEFIRIRSIKASGLIAKWNSENPDKQVKTGYYILSVNGIRSPNEMRAAIADGTVTSITMVVRPVE
mmetsp:Transcript_23383/g.43014  ORF Transcript_23383/g.43014 Transcript_23383/m.43014 type:complete len:173 (-) Transcript_23383:148-666(-)